MTPAARWSCYDRRQGDRCSCACAGARRREDASSSRRISALANHRADCFDNVLIAGAAAEIAREPFANLVVGRERVLADEIGCRHQHAGCAEPALQRMMLAKRLL